MMENDKNTLRNELEKPRINDLIAEDLRKTNPNLYQELLNEIVLRQSLSIAIRLRSRREIERGFILPAEQKKGPK